MKIVIAGAGAVGTHLAKLLAREQYDIVLIDENESQLAKVSGDYDLKTVCNNPSSIRTLQGEVNDAELFIAVTPDESLNMTCCILAHHLGVKKTVARIDNFEYLNKNYTDMFKKIGIDSLIYPEQLAAKEIAASIRYSWVRHWWEVHNSSLIMLGIKLRKEATLLGKPLRELGQALPYHIVAIQRGDEIIVPNGNDVLCCNDQVYFMTLKNYIPLIRKVVGKEEQPDIKRVMIMGGGKTSVRLINEADSYMEFIVVERDEERCHKILSLIRDDRKVEVYNGDGRDMGFLTDIGIQHMDAFVALTGNAETNILSCLTAKNIGIQKTVAMIENLDYVKMAEDLDIGTILNKKTIAAGHIYQLLLKADVSNVRCLALSDADVAEFIAKPGSKVTQKAVKDLGLPHGATIGGLVRGKEGILVHGLTRIQADDHVVIFCNNAIIKKLGKYFN